MTIDNFINQMISFFPDLSYERKKHIEEYNSFLITVFIENNIMPKIVHLLDYNIDNNKIKHIFDYFEEVSIQADNELLNIFSITVLEMLGDNRVILDKARLYMGPQTTILQKEADLDLRR